MRRRKRSAYSTILVIKYMKHQIGDIAPGILNVPAMTSNNIAKTETSLGCSYSSTIVAKKGI